MKKFLQHSFLLIIGLFSLGQIERIQLTKVVAIYCHELVIALWLVISMVKNHYLWQKQWQKWRNSRWLWLGGAWILIGWLIALVNHQLTLIPILYLARVLFYLCFAISLKINPPYSATRQRQWWLVAGLVLAVLGLVQYLFLPDLRFLKYAGWDDHYYRLTSTQFDPNFAGILLAASFFLLQGVEFSRQLAWLKKGFSILLVITILLTYSRASYLGWFLSTVYLIYLLYIQSKKLNYFLLALMAGFIICLPFLPRPGGEGVKLERTYSIESRVKLNQSTLGQMRPYHWLTGQGVFTQTRANQSFKPWPDTAHFPDNLGVFIFSSTGLVGLVIFTWLTVNYGMFLWKNNDVFILSAFFAIIIHSQFNHTLFQPFVWLWMSALTATVKLNKFKT